MTTPQSVFSEFEEKKFRVLERKEESRRVNPVLASLIQHSYEWSFKQSITKKTNNSKHPSACKQNAANKLVSKQVKSCSMKYSLYVHLYWISITDLPTPQTEK